jgi:hypothetical protein
MRSFGSDVGRENTILYEGVAMPIILWLFGFPVTLALVMWLVEIMRF